MRLTPYTVDGLNPLKQGLKHVDKQGNIDRDRVDGLNPLKQGLKPLGVDPGHAIRFC